MMRQTSDVLSVSIDVLGMKDAGTRILSWARERQSRYVCLCNVHVVVSASRDARFREVINGADLATPDGAPVAWSVRRNGFPEQGRVCGPDLMWSLCARCAETGVAPYFYGSTEATLAALVVRLRAVFPSLVIAGTESPPFRPPTADEKAETVRRINASGAGIVFVGLGCPKQETWMAEHRGKINAVMLGVGAAFAFHAGTKVRAPVWMRNNGLEWLHRLVSEPRRLWLRYFVTNTMFIVGTTRQLLWRRQ